MTDISKNLKPKSRMGVDLPALLSRLEAAEGPDREIDHAIKRIVENDVTTMPLSGGFNPRYWRTHVGDGVYFEAPRYGPGGSTNDVYVEGYTASLDAAIALCERVLPGSLWSIAQFRQPVRNHARVFNVRKMSPCVNDDDFYGDAHTPALALCIALVKALIAQQAKGTS